MNEWQIGIDYTAAVRQSAGIGRYTREIVRALARQAPHHGNLHFRLFVAETRPDRVKPPGPSFSIHATRLTERWLARLWYRLRLPIPVELWTGDLHLFHQPDFFLPPTRAGVRTIVTVHDLSFVREPDSVMPGMSRQLNTWVPRSVARADHVIAVSEATRQDLIALYNTPAEKISVLYHGVTPDFSPVTDTARLAQIRRTYGLDERSFVLSVGTLQPRKNFRRLIQAFAQIDPQFMLVIAGGKGWRESDIFAEAERLGLQNRVCFPGFIADADLPALYSAAELFAYPSLYEGFGLPVLEAMACGTPVIVSNRSALPEVVDSAGLLVDPLNVDDIAKAIARVLADAGLRQRLSEAGLRRAARFTWNNVARQLLNLYDSMLQA